MSDFSREASARCKKHGRFSWDDSKYCPSCSPPDEHGFDSELDVPDCGDCQDNNDWTEDWCEECINGGL